MQKVFAVDDDEEMLDLMSDMLTPMGCSMAFAKQCKGALDKIRWFVPDLIMLDVMLPDGSGYEISRSVRADAALYRTPILFVSAISDPPEVEYALTQGCDAYLRKPFSMGDLNGHLRDLNALSLRISQPSAETGLMTLDSITREIDHLIFQRRAFSLCYLFITNFDAYQVHHGADGATRLIAYTGALIRQTLENLQFRHAAAAHLGREHFLALVPLLAYQEFCTKLDADFRALGLPRVSLQIDVSLCNELHVESTHELLHELRSAQRKVEGGQQPTLFRWNLHKEW